MKRVKIVLSGLFLIALLAFTGCDADSDDPFVDPVVEQFNADLAEIDAYLISEGITPLVDGNSGIRYLINEQGTGLQPLIADSLTLSYTSSLISSGNVVEEVVSEKIRASLLLGGVAIASTLIQEGGSITAYIPSVYMYGTQETEEIPANSIIELDMELITVHNMQLRTDIEIIDNVLAVRDTTALIHPTGIRYFIREGSGSDRPSLSSSVTINYTGRFFNNDNSGEVFDSGINVTFGLSNLIQGWQIMLPEMTVGSEVTMILPSDFAYGQTGTQGIPPNSILEFDVELIGFN